ncbi:MAG TPA: hypothetical protein VMV49_08265 [Candidatus Deferrimicrobium sp.]|nr:hypothetical protein [Candidatus Deferrimicrobium sp.]
MQINEISPNLSGVNIKVRVLSMSPPRSVKSKRGQLLRVSEAMLGDTSGRIALTLWEKQIYLVKIGQVIEIKDGYASEFQGILRLTLGRNGSLKVVEDPSFPSMHELLKEIRET